jgi:hypothetical protein
MKPTRIYKAGRPTTGFRRGEKITDPAEVHVGDKLIALSHRFKAENLYRVTAHKGDRFYVVYIQPDGRNADGGEMCVWGFDLTAAREEWFRAVATQQDTT